MNYYLGIDIGTSATKGVCYDINGREYAQKTFEYPLYQPHPGYVEQNPRDWAIATIEVIRYFLSCYTIKGIGLSGQMHGLVLLDKDDNILRPSIIWCDNRSFKEKEQIEQVIGKKRIKEITGNEAMAPFTLAKLLWVKNNEPDIFAKIDKVLLPKDYVKYILTKEFKTEFSDASGTQMLDIANKCYSDEILNAFGIDKKVLPSLCESVDVAGYLREDLFPGYSNVFVVGGAGDQAAGALGNGIIHTNQVSVVLGSSGVVFKPIEKDYISKANVQVFMHAVKDTYHIMGVTNGCGLSYSWYINTLCDYEKITSTDVFDANEAAIEGSVPGANGLIYLPYLNGERTPHNDSFASGCFLGIRQSTSKSDFTRAVIEGICYSIRDTFEATDIDMNAQIYISGGGAKSNMWCSILATMLHTTLHKNNVSEAGTLGMAILAMVANKEYSSIDEAISSIITVKSKIEPNVSNYSTYDKWFKLYQNAYESLKKYYQLQAKLEE